MVDIRKSDPDTTDPLELCTSGEPEVLGAYLLARIDPLTPTLINAVLYNLCMRVADLAEKKADKRIER